VDTVTLQIVLLAVLLFLSGTFSSSETALFSLKPYQVRKLQSRPTRRSLMVGSVLRDPYLLLVTILIGNTMVNVAASSLGTNLMGQFFEQGVVGISVVVMTVLILVFGEVVPKMLAVSNPETVSLGTAPLITAAVRVFTPLRALLEIVIRLLMRKQPGGEGDEVVSPRENVAEAIALGHSEGVLDRIEQEMLAGTFRLMHLSAQNIMTPRTEVFMLSSDLDIGDAVSMVRSSGYSRVPLFNAEKRDDIVGILYAKDLLHSPEEGRRRLADIAREPLFIPESKPLVDLLGKFVSGAAHFAVVIDEYGSFTGIVTLDDILGEIIGRDVARNPEKYRYRRLSKNTWEIPGRMEVEYFNVLLGTSLSGPNIETVAGFVTSSAGEISEQGQQIVIGNLRFTVIEADPRMVLRLRVEKLRR
jgi:CBS domain containing-hemolysin-like protein